MNTKKYHYWTLVKTTDCRGHQIPTSLSLGIQIVKLSFGYTWEKTLCDATELEKAIKVPKLPKGYHIAPDGKRYYNTGSLVFEVKGEACGTQTWTPQDFWVKMQKK